MHWAAMCRLLNVMKKFWPWLATDPYSHNLQQVCKRMYDAWQRCFKKGTKHSGRRPLFKRKDQASSARFPSSLRVEGNRIKVPKIGWIRFFKSREIKGDIRNVTLKKESTGWFVSIQTEREVDQPVHPSASEIGIDVGITRFATFSDGTYVEPLNAFRTTEKRLAKAQRLLSRKQRFSSNWKKQKRIVSRIHSKIANMRSDFLHKLSTTISDSQAVVYVESLEVANMSKSAKGTVEKPGNNVAAKSGLNRSILDQGWSMFRSQLEYKLRWKGGELVAVPPQYTSQRCSKCGNVSKENRRSQAVFCCVECGHSANADTNAAINILRAGQALCGARELSHA